MRHIRLALWPLLCAAGLTVLTAATRSRAGPYTDALSLCLVKFTTDADKTLLVEWMFATVSLHPGVQPLASVSDSTRTDLNRAVAAVVQRLLTASCRSEVRLAVKYEGNGALEASFSVLGQVAAREMFGNPQVTAGAEAFAQYLDAAALKKAIQAADSQ